MSRIVIDFETYYDQSYNLDTMPIDNYVLDDRFLIHGIALKIGNYPADFVHGPYAIGDALGNIDWRHATVVAHNNYFDGFILAQRFGIKPKAWHCTMCLGRGKFGPDVSANLDSLSRRLGGQGKTDQVDFTKGKRTLTAEEMARLATYAIADDEECARIYDLLVKDYPPQELDLIDLTLRMFLEPRLMLDKPLLQTYYEQEMTKKANALEALAWVYPYLDDGSAGLTSFIRPDYSAILRETLMSDDKFAALLKTLRVKVPQKTSKKTGQKRGAFAKTDRGFKAMLDSEDERIKQLAEGRLALKSTITTTRSESFLDVAEAGRPFPIQLYYCGAISKRWSGGGKRNPQNLPRGSSLRTAIIAPPGYKIGVGDSSQIEARLTAYLAKILTGQTCELLEWFIQGKDPYCEFGSKFYKRTITKADAQDRWVSKQAVLGLGFQMGAPRFQAHMKAQADLDFDMEFCEGVVRFYRELFAPIRQLWNIFQGMLEIMVSGGYKDYGILSVSERGMSLPSGLTISYPGLRKVEQVRDNKIFTQFEYFGWKENRKQWINIYGGKLLENFVQALDRQIVAEQMLAVSRRYPVPHNEHDGFMALFPEAEAEAGLRWMLDIMSTPPLWAPDFPVAAEGHLSERYDK